MNDSADMTIGQQNLNKAHLKLAQIQKKIKEFKKQAKVRKSYQQPLPELSNYITFFKQNKGMIHQNNKKQDQFHNQFVKQSSHYNGHNRVQQKQNIQTEKYSQRFLEQKNKTLDKMESFYNEKNFQMDKRIQQLQFQKLKLKKDKQLLIRNNQQIQGAIILKNKLFQTDSKKQTSSTISQLLFKIEQTKKSIAKIQIQNQQIQIRKKQLQSHIKECLKSQRQMLNRDLNINKSRGKPIQAGCQYH